MSACAKCGGQGSVTRTRAYRDHTDDYEVTCPKCSGSGRKACPGCGELSRESDAYCSDACEREDADRAWESSRDAERDDRAAGLID